jgi:hypothetical protein
MKRLFPALVASFALLLTAAPAHAGTGFGPAEVACIERVAAVADGTVYGAGRCNGGVAVYVRRPGQPWRSSGILWPHKRVEAVAADQVATYVLMSCTPGEGDHDCDIADPLGHEFFIAKLPHGGRPSAVRHLGGTEGGNTDGTLIARDGQWWAAYTSAIRDRDVEGSGRAVISWTKTYGGAGRGEIALPADAGARTFADVPSLAFTSSGVAIAFHSLVDRPGEKERLQLATAGMEGRFTVTPYSPTDPAAAPYSALTSSNGQLVLAWSRDGRPALAIGVHAPRIDLPSRGTIAYRGISVAASGGLVTVTTAETFLYQRGQTTRVYARILDAAGRLLSTTELTAPAGRANPYLQGRVNGSTAARGLASVAFFDGRDKTATQR